MHHDSPIKDWTTVIKGDHGPHDVGSCPLFVRDVDASWPSKKPSLDRTVQIACEDFSYKTVFSLF